MEQLKPGRAQDGFRTSYNASLRILELTSPDICHTRPTERYLETPQQKCGWSSLRTYAIMISTLILFLCTCRSRPMLACTWHVVLLAELEILTTWTNNEDDGSTTSFYRWFIWPAEILKRRKSLKYLKSQWWAALKRLRFNQYWAVKTYTVRSKKSQTSLWRYRRYLYRSWME